MGSSGGQVNISLYWKDYMRHMLTYNLWIRLGSISFCRDSHDILENHKEQQRRFLLYAILYS